jgi:cytochrome c553
MEKAAPDSNDPGAKGRESRFASADRAARESGEEDRMKMPLMLAAGAALAMSLTHARAGEVVAGEERYLENCVNCHGKTGKGMASFPAVAGRDPSYISERLTTYRAKEMVGPNSAIMMSLAEDLSDEDIANLAAYIASTFQ